LAHGWEELIDDLKGTWTQDYDEHSREDQKNQGEDKFDGYFMSFFLSALSSLGAQRV